jgi:polysaccharide biosynthesis/export protein
MNMLSQGRRSLGVLACVWIVAQAACRGAGSYTWFDALPPEGPAPEYTVNAGDVVNIRVLGHDDMTTRVRVRGDGRIAVPIIGEVDARGKHPSGLRAEIEAKLKDYLVMPSVTLNIDEMQPVTVAVLGEVGHPGVFPFDPNMRLAEVLALGGGVTDFASRDSIFVVRTSPRPARIRFTYDAVTRNDGNAAAFRLHPGDVVVVE